MLFVGLALGVAMAVPGFVERAGARALASAERSLGVQITLDSVDWSFNGAVRLHGVRVRPQDAPAEEPDLLTAASIEAQVEPLWLRGKVRLEHAAVHEPMVRPRLRLDGTNNVSGILDRLGALAEPQGSSDKAEQTEESGLKSLLDRNLPGFEVHALEVEFGLDHPTARMAGIPSLIQFHRGVIQARNTALLREDDSLSWTISFEETSLDPGHGIVLKGELPIHDIDPLRLPLDVRFDRRVEMSIRDRVVGLTGGSWDGAELVLDGLVLSQNPALRADGDQPNGEPALEAASVVIEPDLEASLDAAKAIVGAADRSVAIRRLLKTIRRVELDRPRFVFERRPEGHNFRDLVPKAGEGAGQDGDQGDQALGPLMEATQAAIQRLITSKPDTDGRSFRGLLVRGFSHLERRVAGVSAAALQ
ncbi:MAG: hypothetical protein QF464_03755, partial [Myxococcota bacterium]|nr:hypothetical protein [Myxococcota bacterium]